MHENAQRDLIESDIERVLACLCANPQAAAWSYPEWTRQVKAAVGQVARASGYDWLASSEPSGELLWDGVAQERDDARNLVRVPLALESEWMGKAAIKRDFEKLVMSRAEHKVMVCAAVSHRGVERHFDGLRVMIDACRPRQSGDRYLLAGWFGKEHTPGRFIFALHVI